MSAAGTLKDPFYLPLCISGNSLGVVAVLADEGSTARLLQSWSSLTWMETAIQPRVHSGLYLDLSQWAFWDCLQIMLLYSSSALHLLNNIKAELLRSSG